MPTLDARAAQQSTVKLFWTGIAVLLIGIVSATMAHPSTTRTGYGNVHTSGSEVAYSVALAVAAAGSTIVWVALIAYAVRLGIRAART